MAPYPASQQSKEPASKPPLRLAPVDSAKTPVVVNLADSDDAAAAALARKASANAAELEQTWSFPAPAALEGVANRSKPVMKVQKVTFRDSGGTKASFLDVSLTLSQCSRMVIQASAGDGHESLVEVLVGRQPPTSGEILKVQGLRLASVAADSLQRLQQHSQKTAVQYIMWRYEGQLDREMLLDAQDPLTAEERAARAMKWCIDGTTRSLRPCANPEITPQDEAAAVVPQSIASRRQNMQRKAFEYQVELQPGATEQSVWVDRDTLIKMGYLKFVQQEDKRQEALAGSAVRQLAESGVQSHLSAFGVGSEVAGKAMCKLTKQVKFQIALAAAMWQSPHILLLVEPEQCLGRQGMESLRLAIEQYKGGVVLISGWREFAARVATETWTLRSGRWAASGSGPSRAELQEMSFKDKALIKELERKIKANRTSPLEDAEVQEIADQLSALKELLLSDVQLQDPQDDDGPGYELSGMEELVESQLSDLLLEEFGADLPNFRRTQKEWGLKLSLLVQRNNSSDDDDDEPELDLLGFLAYKTWGPPIPAVSVGAVGVAEKHRGKGYGRVLMKVAEDRAALLGLETAEGIVPGEVRLRSLASAVKFYERIGYERIEEDESCKPAENTPACPNPEGAEADDAEVDDDDLPCVPMRRPCAPPSPRSRAVLEPLLSPKQDPWSPSRSRALEDGPTWPAMDAFMLPEAQG